MIKIEIKNRFTGVVIFEYSKDKNTIKETLLEAIKKKTDLRDSNLRGSNLRGSNLRGSDLSGSDLRDSDLRGSDLRDSDLRGSDLRDSNLRGSDLRDSDLSGSDLSGSDLSDSNLRGSDLRGSDLRGSNICGYKIKKAIVFTGLYRYIVIPFITMEDEEFIKLGCYTRKLSEWEFDFWNNDKEFPNNGSEKSNLRILAFNTAKEWLNLQTK